MTLLLLSTGYLLAVPFTVWLPGFRRLWRRREPLVFASAQLGALLVAAGYGFQRQMLGVILNGGWAAGLTVAYVLEGRKRVSSAPPSASAPSQPGPAPR